MKPIAVIITVFFQSKIAGKRNVQRKKHMYDNNKAASITVDCVEREKN